MYSPPRKLELNGAKLGPPVGGTSKVRPRCIMKEATCNELRESEAPV